MWLAEFLSKQLVKGIWANSWLAELLSKQLVKGIWAN